MNPSLSALARDWLEPGDTVSHRTAWVPKQPPVTNSGIKKSHHKQQNNSPLHQYFEKKCVLPQQQFNTRCVSHQKWST
jgi:hypothetical protein